MKTLTVALPGREYDILIQRGLLAQAGERVRAVLPQASKLAAVTDSNVEPLYRKPLLDSLTAAPWIPAICFTIDSPSPVPPEAFDRLLSTRKNRSNTRA